MTLRAAGGGRKGRARLALAVALVAIGALLATAGSAAARTIPLYAYTGEYYDGFGSTAGTLAQGSDVDVNQSTGSGYVTDPARLNGSVAQFDPDGDPLAFPALDGATAIPLNSDGASKVAVDNSGGASQGSIYVLDATGLVWGFRPDGNPIGESFPIGGLQAACSLAVDSDGEIWAVDYRRSLMFEYAPSGAPTGQVFPFAPIAIGQFNGFCELAIDSDDNFYLSATGFIGVSYGKKYDSDGDYVEDFTGGYAESVAVDLANDHVFTLQPTPFPGGEFNYEVFEYDENGDVVTTFGATDPSHSFPGLIDPRGIAVNSQTGDVYVINGRDYEGRQHIEIFSPDGVAVVPTVKTDRPELAPTVATLKGSVDLDGAGDTTDCYFEWGETFLYGNVAPCAPPGPLSGPGTHQVEAVLEGLTQGAVYHYRLVAKNANGIPAFGRDRGFRPQGPATMTPAVVSDVNTDGARISTSIDPNGGETTYRVEYGLADCDLGGCATAPLPEGALAKALGTQPASIVLAGLQPDVTHHYRLVATNATGETVGDEDTFRTYAIETTADSCANALVRKEVAAVLLPDCRAYELVSAADAGGYDVLSDLVPGQVPYAARPRARDRVLYSLSAGTLPGIAGEPTNHGSDPYLATRTGSGWTTAYAGIPVGFPPAQPPFSSTAAAASENLSTLVFGGPDICGPCFADGTTGLPLRREGGTVVQGLAGSLDPGPGVVEDGYVGRRLSADGKHLIFGSTSALESGAAGGGDISIYDRNLETGVTRVVSKTPAGGNLPCLQGPGNCHGPGNGDGIASLDVSADGVRIVVANRVATDSAGNDRWHPYMSIGGAAGTVDLAPGTTGGVLYNGMTADGSTVYYTTTDPLVSDDSDTSADIYRADVAEDGAFDLTLVSDGPTGDSDACDPVAGLGSNWNAPGAVSPNRCGAVAYAGGAGVARSGGAIFFLSPERLDDGPSGILNEPNLYVSRPGVPLEYIATLEPDSEAIEHAVYDSEESSFGDFQAAAGGNFTVFSSSRPLTGFPTFGHAAIYRYAATGEKLVCASCPTTRASLTADTGLSNYGLNLADDGRVFFTSAEPLALRDTGGTADVYEWSGGRISMLSTGRSQTDSGLLSASADGVDAFFYTRETLVSGDRNGKTIKIYTAREGGGFASPVVPKDCQASDECHGPGSAAPPVEPLPTFQGTGGNHPKKALKKKKKKKKKKRRRGSKHHGGKGHTKGQGR